MTTTRNIFVTGGTGYMGRSLVPELLRRGHTVRALVRAGSEKKLSGGCDFVVGDALQAASYAEHVRPADTFIHLVGVPHPKPSKAQQFGEIDLPSVMAAARAASSANVKYFIYLSVAQPAPIMKVYVDVRAKGEEIIRASGMNATFLRPWYVLGPGHRWPYALLPAYWLCGLLPPTKESARRLGLLTLSQMIRALVWAVENPPEGMQILNVPRIKELGKTG